MENGIVELAYIQAVEFSLFGQVKVVIRSECLIYSKGLKVVYNIVKSDQVISLVQCAYDYLVSTFKLLV